MDRRLGLDAPGQAERQPDGAAGQGPPQVYIDGDDVSSVLSSFYNAIGMDASSQVGGVAPPVPGLRTLFALVAPAIVRDLQEEEGH